MRISLSESVRLRLVLYRFVTLYDTHNSAKKKLDNSAISPDDSDNFAQNRQMFSIHHSTSDGDKPVSFLNVAEK